MYPDIASVAVQSGDVMVAVYEAAGGDEIRLARCVATNTCQSSTDWTVTTPYREAGAQLKYPQLATDGTKQILIFQKDDTIGTPGGERIYAMERCGTGSWSAISLLRTPDGGATSVESQSIQFGRPSIALNRDENIVHVVFRETDANTAELWWSRRAYADCP